HTINELHRLSFTRFRVCGHSLVCETGRWNRRGRGRLLPEERLCMCGDVQNERHLPLGRLVSVILLCPNPRISMFSPIIDGRGKTY
ncbi:hypothetical protein SK128_018360, partial [Halocaridina rubra]